MAEKYDILLQNSFTNVATFIQEAALAALNAPAAFRERLMSNLTRKRNPAYGVLSDCRYLTTDNAQGSFYLFPRLPDGFDDRETVYRLLEQGVAVVPGSAFGPGGAGHIRLTFTQPDDILLEGVQRLVQAVTEMAE